VTRFVVFAETVIRKLKIEDVRKGFGVSKCGENIQEGDSR